MVILIGGCAKEYSHEGGPEQDSTMSGDIIVRQDFASITLPDCKGCNSTDTSSVFYKNGKIIKVNSGRFKIEF